MTRRVQVVCDPGSTWRASPDEPLARARDRWPRLVETVRLAGADVLKPQLLRPSVYPDGSREAALVAPYELPEDWLPWIKGLCDDAGLGFACTVYRPEDVRAVAPLCRFGKVASFEAMHEVLWGAWLATGLPLVVSTGTLTNEETERVGAVLGPKDTILLAVSKYPAAVEDYDLSLLYYWSDPLGCARGVSDHTPPGCYALAPVAVAMYASMLEVHVGLDRDQPSPDARFSRGPLELADYVAAVREAEGLVFSKRADGSKRVAPGELTWARWDKRTGRRGTRGGDGG